MTSNMMKNKWDAEADQRLIVAILSATQAKVDFALIARMLGPHRTPRAVEERVKKLKKTHKDFDVDPGTSAVALDAHASAPYDAIGDPTAVGNPVKKRRTKATGVVGERSYGYKGSGNDYRVSLQKENIKIENADANPGIPAPTTPERNTDTTTRKRKFVAEQSEEGEPDPGTEEEQPVIKDEPESEYGSDYSDGYTTKALDWGSFLSPRSKAQVI
ncbi:MAG: hypothetical protein M1817_003702 [Caeruleum heppii]|nr:MAG: hypothetical protein M1817_003702 [Caeruleum heppii]